MSENYQPARHDLTSLPGKSISESSRKGSFKTQVVFVLLHLKHVEILVSGSIFEFNGDRFAAVREEMLSYTIELV